MKNPHPTPSPANSAPNDPSADRPAQCACCAEDAALAARQSRVLEELVEIGMRMARNTEKQAAVPLEPGVAPRDFALMFSRIARAVRMTLAFEARLAADRRALAEKGAAARAAERAAQEQRAAEARARRLARQKDKAKHLIYGMIKAKRTSVGKESEQIEEMHERLEDFDDYAELGTLSFGAVLARICRDLGLTPDWRRWENESWAVEEARTNAPGSPYAADPTAERKPAGSGTRRVVTEVTGPP
jgi:hypothetical protein